MMITCMTITFIYLYFRLIQQYLIFLSKVTIGISAILLCGYIELNKAQTLSSCKYIITDIENDFTPRTLDLSPLYRSIIQYTDGLYNYSYAPCGNLAIVGKTDLYAMFYVNGTDICDSSNCWPVFSSYNIPTYDASSHTWTFKWSSGTGFFDNVYLTNNWRCKYTVPYFRTVDIDYHMNVNENYLFHYFEWTIESQYACSDTNTIIIETSTSTSTPTSNDDNASSMSSFEVIIVICSVLSLIILVIMLVLFILLWKAANKKVVVSVPIDDNQQKNVYSQQIDE